MHEMDWIHLWDWMERVPVIVRCARCDEDVCGCVLAPQLVPASPLQQLGLLATRAEETSSRVTDSHEDDDFE